MKNVILTTADGTASVAIADVPDWVFEYAAYRREGGTQPVEQWLPEHGYTEALQAILAERQGVTPSFPDIDT